MAETPTLARSRWLEVAHERREEHSSTDFTLKVKKRRAGASKQLFPMVKQENASIVGLKSEPWINAEMKALLEFLVFCEIVGVLPGKW